MKLFISYSRRDLAFVERLARDLTKAGHTVWYDLSNLEGGDRWGVEIQNAIRQSEVALVVISPSSVASEWVEKEFLYASNRHLRVVPLLYQACELPLWLLNIHYIDVQGGNYQQNFPHILRVLAGAPQAGKAGVRPAAVGKPTKGSKTKTVLISAGVLAMVCVVVFIGVLLVSNGGLAKILSAIGLGNLPATSPPSTEHPATEPPPTEPPVTEEPSIPLEITDSKGVPMVLIPAGEFMMGSEGGELDERPVHNVYLDAYYIDKYEVTNGFYYLCEQNGICSWPYDTGSYTRPSYYGNVAFNDYPVININWEQAQRFCEFRGGNLPTEAQWEKAARGAEQLTYPWGESISCNYANISGCVGDTTQVGSYELGKSPYGAYDMTGNVREWVFDWYMNTYYAESPLENPTGPSDQYFYVKYVVLRGGSWGSDAYLSRSTVRLPLTPGVGGVDTGFRCVRDANP